MIARFRTPPHKRSKFGQALHRSGVANTEELRRIVDLPRRRAEFENAQDLTPLYRRDELCSGCRLCAKGLPVLFPIQSAMLWDAHRQNGLFAPVCVGCGKTLVTLLLPDAMNARTTVLFIRPSLRSQLLDVDIPTYDRHFNIPVVFQTPDDRPGVYLVTYSDLSSARKADILEQIKPDLIIADEAHSFRHRDAARTKRFLRYFKDHPETRFAALSGTMTTRTILDYEHLISLALRDGSPLPRKYLELRDWSSAIDDTENPMPPGKLMMFCKEGENVRQGYRRRLVETPGVVSTSESALGTSLVICGRSPKIPEVVAKALNHLRTYWEWEGEELEDAMAFSRVARQLSGGFYLKWVWGPSGPDREWLEARAAWHKEVRDMLKRSNVGLDSPLLLANAARHSIECLHKNCERKHFKSFAWQSWAAVKDRPLPPVEAVWLSDFLIEDALHWSGEIAEDGKVPGIIWYANTAFGERVAERGKFPFFGPGPTSASQLDSVSPEEHPVIVCSIQAHGQGKNLQRYSRSLVTNTPASGQVWEQLLGRSHRPGQLADEVSCSVYCHTEELVSAWQQAEKDASYIEQTTGQMQKLSFASREGI